MKVVPEIWEEHPQISTRAQYSEQEPFKAVLVPSFGLH